MKQPTSLRDKAAQLVFIRFGSNMSPKVEAADDLARVTEQVRQHGIGGVLFFNGGTSESAAQSLSSLQAASDIPLTVAADMERGLAQQITDMVAWPHALAFDHLGEQAASAVEQFAWSTGREARAIGVHASFSPVADIHRNPDNPIIANRAFARTPERAAELAAAYVRGCHRAGILCCAKHFPGHGNTHEDSHASLPIVDESRALLDATDLLPFRCLVDTGVDMFMTAHVSYPALDPSGQPATLSRPILTELLRDDWDFDGVVVSDSLKMDGATGAATSEGELAVRAIAAGVDLLLDVSDVAEVLDAIEAAAERDVEVAARVERAFTRAWALKQRAISIEQEAGSTTTTSGQDEAMRVARAAVRVLHNPGDVSFPLRTEAPLGFLLVNPLGDNAYTKTTQIVERFQRADRVAATFAFGPDSTEQDATVVREAFGSCEIVVIAIVIKPFAWHDARLPAWQAALLDELCSSRTAVVASLGIEETISPYKKAAALLVTDSDAPVSQDALTEKLLGSLP